LAFVVEYDRGYVAHALQRRREDLIECENRKHEREQRAGPWFLLGA
jgi:hypothetical protein